MALESATWISELDPTNPPGTDKKKQGDDHLRMFKQAVKNSLPNASKAFYFPTTEAKTASFTVVAADQNKTFLVDTTSGVVVMTLPTLAVGDAGWECFLLKTNTGTNEVRVTPATGTIQSGDLTGLAFTRRCIPGKRSRIFWTGSAWLAERVVDVPVGTVIDCPRTGLAVGYEWPSGQTLGAAYPDFIASNGASGVTTDRRGRLAYGKDNLGGSASNRLNSANGGGANASILGAGIGQDTNTLAQVHLPVLTLPLSLTLLDPGHTHVAVSSGTTLLSEPLATTPTDIGSFPALQSLRNVVQAVTVSTSINTNTTGISVSGTVSLGGGAASFTNVAPGIVSHFMLVVE